MIRTFPNSKIEGALNLVVDMTRTCAVSSYLSIAKGGRGVRMEDAIACVRKSTHHTSRW